MPPQQPLSAIPDPDARPARRIGMLASFERRITFALLLILVSTLGLQILSEQHVVELRRETDAFRESITQADRVRLLAEAVAQFRVAGTALEAPRTAREAIDLRNELTDAAIAIGNTSNEIGAEGGPRFRNLIEQAAFSDLGDTIAALTANPAGAAIPDGVREQVDRQNHALGGAVRQIENAVRDDRNAAYDNVSQSAENWNNLVRIAGLITITLAAGICFDLLRNILPALRRIHRALRRLAEGDLDVRIERSGLSEISQLSDALETFRQIARTARGLANTDAATGLPNRRAFHDCMARNLEDLNCRQIMVMLADIDRFKYINDDYGHPAGDRLIALIGERLEATLGSQHGFVARFGGDEFAALVAVPGEQASGELADVLADRVIAAMRVPFDIGSTQIAVTLSLGHASAFRDRAGEWVPANPNDLLVRADLALYAAKESGRDAARAFCPAMLAQHELARTLENDLRDAIDRGELRMVYQPIVAVDGACREVEALARWRHPRRGDVPPASFIDAAERSGLIVRLGTWIVERCLTDMGRWRDLSVSINLSPVQLQHPSFVDEFIDSCRRHAVDARRICLEVTESISIERDPRALESLRRLRVAGCRIALDDFGKGYSSLSLLRAFRFDRLKLDRELVENFASDPDSGLLPDPAVAAVFEAAVMMALRLGAEVLAEGIGSGALVAPVRAAGCTHMQGYHFSPPLEAADVAGHFARRVA